jgi:hypothetical protein
VLRNLPFEEKLTPEEMVYVWGGVEVQARKVIEAAESFFTEPVDPVPELRDQVDGLLAEADRRQAEGDFDGEAALAMRALAYDPFRLGTRQRLNETVARVTAAADAADPLEGASGFVVLVDAEELLGGDDLLVAYAEALGGAGGVTLAIDATRLPAETAGAELQALVQRCGLAERSDVEMLAVVGERELAERYRMLHGIHARYRRDQAPDGAGGEGASGGRVPVFTPESLPQLRELARRSI